VALDEVLPGSTKSWKEGSGVQHNASVWGPIKNLEDATEDTGEFWDNPAATLMAD
jgi:hypothetical protein